MRNHINTAYKTVGEQWKDTNWMAVHSRTKKKISATFFFQWRNVVFGFCDKAAYEFHKTKRFDIVFFSIQCNVYSEKNTFYWFIIKHFAKLDLHYSLLLFCPLFISSLHVCIYFLKNKSSTYGLIADLSSSSKIACTVSYRHLLLVDWNYTYWSISLSYTKASIKLIWRFKKMLEIHLSCLIKSDAYWNQFRKFILLHEFDEKCTANIMYWWNSLLEMNGSKQIAARNSNEQNISVKINKKNNRGADKFWNYFQYFFLEFLSFSTVQWMVGVLKQNPVPRNHETTKIWCRILILREKIRLFFPICA